EVFEGVAGYDDEICLLARLQRSHRVEKSTDHCAVSCAGNDDLHGRHPRFLHELHFTNRHPDTVVTGCRIVTKRDDPSRLNEPPKVTDLDFPDVRVITTRG